MQELFGALRTNQEATNAFLSAITGAEPLGEFMSPDNLRRVVGEAAMTLPHSAPSVSRLLTRRTSRSPPMSVQNALRMP